jgi:dTDP-4-amino-4,6-dideoxygalactose transaminase
MEGKTMAGPGAYLFGDEERKELLDVMETGYLSRYGSESDPRFKQKVVTFEKEFAEYVGTKHAICVNGGTGAILICLTALGIGPGDEVIVPGYTFIASISAICYARAIPVLAEIDESLTIDPDDIEKKITSKTKAIMPVHMLGNPCNMDRIMEIAKKHNLYVIEDCCQINGGSYKG